MGAKTSVLFIILLIVLDLNVLLNNTLQLKL